MRNGIHWFRRDLRIHGNPALTENYKRYKEKVLGVFCFDKKFLQRPDFSHNRFQFFIESLKILRAEMRSIGSDLLFLDIGPEEAFKKLFTTNIPQTISFNRDYEPFARARDAKMTEFFKSKNIEVITERDHVLIEPYELLKPDKTPYQVFTPFQKKWLEHFESSTIQKRLLPLKEIKNKISVTAEDDLLEKYSQENLKKVTIPIPKAGHREALEYLKTFEPKLNNYGKDRDFPSIPGTSKFSLFFKNGSLTLAQVISHFKFKKLNKFFSELIWREFYYSILYHFPQVERESFNPKYKNIAWENNEEYFTAWKEGKTGYPIVDAGMRELNQTGWMHNRIRMIVASFLTKDLLVNWQWGEKYFMEKLLDGDLAPNNGGWQWAASTGCDAQPYFRIFNPLLQSQKFDPHGDYIRKYIPELKHLDSKSIHEPTKEQRGSYPEPIVDHAIQREKALKMYKVI
jgi:deoxyribodipyrimidine photo-lyase